MIMLALSERNFPIMNYLNNAGIEKFKPLIEEFALLKNLRVELLADQSHINEYNNGAYAKS